MHRVWYYGAPSTHVKLTPKWSASAWLENSDLSQDTCDTKFLLRTAVGSKTDQPTKLFIDSLILFDPDAPSDTPIYEWTSHSFVVALSEAVRVRCPRPQKVVMRGYYTLIPEVGVPEHIVFDHDLPFDSRLRGGGG
jgi:hypothetical protein